MDEGPKYIRDDQNDLQTQSLRQQMDDVKTGWQDLQVLWANRKTLVDQSMNHQVKSLKIVEFELSLNIYSIFRILKNM